MSRIEPAAIAGELARGHLTSARRLCYAVRSHRGELVTRGRLPPSLPVAAWLPCLATRPPGLASRPGSWEGLQRGERPDRIPSFSFEATAADTPGRVPRLIAFI